jgi:hypothetical protein
MTPWGRAVAEQGQTAFLDRCVRSFLVPEKALHCVYPRLAFNANFMVPLVCSGTIFFLLHCTDPTFAVALPTRPVGRPA